MNSETTSRITKSLSKACADIRKSKPHRQRRLAIVFAVPDVRQTHYRYMDDRIRRWLIKIKGIDCDALAWIFPAGARKTKWRKAYYPGVAVLVKEI